ncbi:MAG: hypothetical protein JWN65_246 [Solirubrobacterales bacterium]|nr:hypothetical protein [Solirubrobacterales bacterium]
MAAAPPGSRRTMRRCPVPVEAHAALLLTVLLLTGALAACGGNDNGGGALPRSPESGTKVTPGAGGQALPATDAADVLTARRTINAVCRPGRPATDTRRLTAAVSTIVRILRAEGGDRIYEVGSGERAQPMTIVAHDVTGQLRSCDADAQARRLAPWVR